jgi:D-3-phosphoglycerate dehydrogenase
MKKSTVLVNTARGGMVDESALHSALSAGVISGAALDVFDKEPYVGPLTELSNCILTCHLGSCTEDCHTAMELKAAEEAVRFFQDKPLQGLIPRSANLFLPV